MGANVDNNENDEEDEITNFDLFKSCCDILVAIVDAHYYL